MSYIDPQAWDDVDFAGNPLDWSSRKNKLLYPAYEMLRLALKERCDACGYSLPTILSNKIDSNIFISYEWKNAFQNTITTIIPRFVNHTINNGDFNGLDNIPMWTETDILNEIGATERIPISYLFLADWEIQQYKILNVLRWIIFNENILESQNGKQYITAADKINGTWFYNALYSSTYNEFINKYVNHYQYYSEANGISFTYAYDYVEDSNMYFASSGAVLHVKTIIDMRIKNNVIDGIYEFLLYAGVVESRPFIPISPCDTQGIKNMGTINKIDWKHFEICANTSILATTDNTEHRGGIRISMYGILCKPQFKFNDWLTST